MIDAGAARALRDLLDTRPVAALGTLHRGDPAVSMVPFVLPAGSTALLIHVSALATHTRDMREHPRVSVLVTAELAAGQLPQALPRVTLAADAAELERTDPAYDAARAAYLARFPDAAMTFELADFGLFALQPVAVRRVAGFGQADSLVGDPLLAWLAGR